MIYLQDADLTLYQGEVSEVLRSLEAESVHCVVTSPPYWGLRDYGTGMWDGGNPDCDHLGEPFRTKANLNKNWGAGFSDVKNKEGRQPFGATCGKCGARRVDSQLGLEPTPDLYLERMVAVFREVRRVLRADGTCWLNIGDSYNGGGPNGGYSEKQASNAGSDGAVVKSAPGLKPKDLCMIPARLALALQADGWWLRSQIVWSKPNPMPESVTDRPTSSYELVYLLTKRPRYFFDAEAVRERITSEASIARARSTPVQIAPPQHHQGRERRGRRPIPLDGENGCRNVRNVWEIATQPYPEAHFATYPEELVRRCILAGTSERGCCPKCGAPIKRVVAREMAWPRLREDKFHTLGWNPTCNHLDFDAERPTREGTETLERQREGRSAMSDKPSSASSLTVPCTILDPFFGSGTTGLVARKHGRRTVGIELSPDYCALAARRLAQLSLLSEVNHVV